MAASAPTPGRDPTPHHRQHPRSNHGSVSIILAVCICLLALAACGSSSRPGNETASAGFSDPLRFANCMRSHGVSNFPDPAAHGQSAMSPSEVQSPAFRSAQRACQHLLNTGVRRQKTAAEPAVALRFAECMRSHGDPHFPDPTGPAPNGLTPYPALLLYGMLFPLVPGDGPASPAYRQAATKCGQGVPP